MSKRSQALQATDGPSGLATRRNFLRGSGAAAAPGVMSLATDGLLGGVADGATVPTAQASQSSAAGIQHGALSL